MMSGIRLEQGDVILVNVPFTNYLESKRRPALILSREDYNSKSEDIIICGITSNLDREPYSLLLEPGNMDEGQLNFTSRIRADKIFSIEKKIVRRKLGKVNDHILNKIKEAVKELIG